MDSKCGRCGKKDTPLQMSRFNTEMCCSSCLSKEKKHPKYEEAVQTELGHIFFGNYNFEGIGLPDDLKPTKSK